MADVFKANVSAASFHATDIGAVEVCSIPELFLGYSDGLPDSTKSVPEGESRVVVSAGSQLLSLTT